MRQPRSTGPINLFLQRGEQGLTVERIEKNMTKIYEDRDAREQELEVTWICAH
jgi:hypothetical protein